MKSQHEKTLLGLCLVFVVSLFYSKAGLSISMGVMVALGVTMQKDQLKTKLLTFLKDKAFVGLTLVFLVYLLSGINSDDTAQWIKQVRIKLPFLLLPLAWFLIGQVSERSYKWIHIALATIAVISAIPVMVYYFTHTNEVLAAIGRGQYMETPIDHIHYSIILAYASCALLLLLVDNCIHKARWEVVISLVLSLLLIAILHLLAVRSGLVILYLGLAFVTVWYIYSSKKYMIGLVGLLVLMIAPYIMYKTVPSLNKKIGYMVWDLTQYAEGKGINYSDSERLMSYGIALDLIKENPTIGHGVGDLKPLMVERHKEKYGEKEKYIFPHNQYLYVLAAVGIIGFLLFFIGLLSPMLFYVPDPYIWLIYIAMIASFMVENTLQRAVSIAFFLFFILLGLARRKACNIS